MLNTHVRLQFCSSEKSTQSLSPSQTCEKKIPEINMHVQPNGSEI